MAPWLTFFRDMTQAFSRAFDLLMLILYNGIIVIGALVGVMTGAADAGVALIVVAMLLVPQRIAYKLGEKKRPKE